MGVETMSALDELMTRAGASDTDRVAWLAERRTGCTATQIRDILLEQMGLPSWSKKQALIDEKLGRRVDTFTGSAYTDWGNDREPVVASVLADEGFVPESRVFRHPDNARYLASPDGLRMNFDGSLEVLEIKTASHDLPPKSEEIQKKGYELQVQWVMFVLGVNRCRFVVEERIGTPGQFEPGKLHRHWIERDDTMIARLVKAADDFLAELDRQREHGAPEIVIDEVLDTHGVNYLRGQMEEKAGKELREKEFATVLGMVETDQNFLQESDLCRISFTAAVTEERDVFTVDREKARAAAPELYSRLEQAADDVVQAQVALAVEQDAVNLHEKAFAMKTGVEIVQKKKHTLRITEGKAMKESKS